MNMSRTIHQSVLWAFPIAYRAGFNAGKADVLAGSILDEDLGLPPDIEEDNRAWWRAGYYTGFALYFKD